MASWFLTSFSRAKRRCKSAPSCGALGLLTAALLCAAPSVSRAGQIFVTGHDPDYHAFQGGNTTGAQHIIQDAIKFVTNNVSNPKLLLVTDLRNPGGDQSDPRFGMNASGFAGKYDVADYGSGTLGVLNLNTVNFSAYDAIVVASDYGGWLRQDELDILNSRTSDIINYLNAGGGLFAMAEGGDRAVPPGTYAETTHDRYGYLPFLVTSAALNQTEVGNTVTAFGQSLGLVASDINGNASHNIFTSTGGMNIVDKDSSGDILSLAVQSQISSGGVVPEPASVTLLSLGSLAFLARAYRSRRREKRIS